LAAEARAVGQSVADGARSLLALAVVVGVAVMREGSEVALFLYGIVAAGGGSGASIAVGGGIGLVLGALVCLLTYLGLVRIPAKPLFRVTTVLIALLAAGMAAQATAFLAQANWVTAFGNVVWDTSWLVSDESMLGKALHTLIGYTDQPTEMQLLVYAAVLLMTFMLMRLTGSQSTDHTVAAS
jgi:high-affinity iron transporter